MTGDDRKTDRKTTARQLRLEALRIHKELLDKFSIEDTREIIRNLTVMEAIFTRVEDKPPMKVVDKP